MLSYCWKCRKDAELKTLELQEQKEENLCFSQNVQCGTLTNQDLLKSMKLLHFK